MPNKRTAFNKAMNLAVFAKRFILLAETQMAISAIRKKGWTIPVAKTKSIFNYTALITLNCHVKTFCQYL